MSSDLVEYKDEILEIKNILNDIDIDNFEYDECNKKLKKYEPYFLYNVIGNEMYIYMNIIEQN